MFFPNLPALYVTSPRLPEYGGLTPVHGTQQLFQAALRAGMVPRPWCWVPSLVRFLGYDRVVGSSKLNSGALTFFSVTFFGEKFFFFLVIFFQFLFFFPKSSYDCLGDWFSSCFTPSVTQLAPPKGLFDALLDAGVLATFCGHDHASDVACREQGHEIHNFQRSKTAEPH